MYKPLTQFAPLKGLVPTYIEFMNGKKGSGNVQNIYKHHITTVIQIVFVLGEKSVDLHHGLVRVALRE